MCAPTPVYPATNSKIHSLVYERHGTGRRQAIFTLYLTVWDVELVVTHQTSWLESTGLTAMVICPGHCSMLHSVLSQMRLVLKMIFTNTAAVDSCTQQYA